MGKIRIQSCINKHMVLVSLMSWIFAICYIWYASIYLLCNSCISQTYLLHYIIIVYTMYLNIHIHAFPLVCCSWGLRYMLLFLFIIIWLLHGVYVIVWTWWRHQMETFSALQTHCARNSRVIDKNSSILRCRYNAVIFYRNLTKYTTYLARWGMGCNLWFDTLIYIVLQST